MRLSTKIPPPLVLLITLIFMYAIARYSKPEFPLLDFSSVSTGFASAHYFLLALIVVLGFSLMILGVQAFKKAKTTVNPLKPEQASQLVVKGVYAYTRNPMYLGMLLLAFAWGAFLLSLLALLMLPVFILYIYFFQIRAEEAAMEKLFGNDFVIYKKRVRRWL